MSKLDVHTQIQFNLDEIYSVSDFLSLCHTTIENNIPACWLKGEISNFSRSASKHWYFSLKDKQGQIRCAVFRLNQRHINFILEDGMEVLLRASPTLYEARGNFQLIVLRIEPVGVGNLQVAFEQLKAKLRDQGLFDAKYKKNLPAKVNTIGVISSSNGAVIQDIIKVLNKRYPFVKILLFDCVVQGKGAAEKLSQALYAADKYGSCDTLILARGGGSLEDLWAFNEEVLAKAIFVANTPIISAVGHETDTTIADFVADKRAPTPSAAAMMATPDRLELLTNLSKLRTDLLQKMQQTLDEYQSQLNQLNLKIPKSNQQLNAFSQKLYGLHANLNYYTNTKIHLNQHKLNTLCEQLKQHSPNMKIAHNREIAELDKIQLMHNIGRIITKQHLMLSTLSKNLEKSIHQHLMRQQARLSINTTGLNHLSPLNTIARGYSMTMLKDSRVLGATTEVKIGALITTHLSDGKIYSQVKNIEKN